MSNVLQEPVDRPTLVILLKGIERRRRAGLVLLDRDRAVVPGGAS